MLNVIQVALHRPHTARLRVRRNRRLRPIKTSRAAEIWYLNRMTDLIQDCKGVIRKQLQGSSSVRQILDAKVFAKELKGISDGFNPLKNQADYLARLAAKKALHWTDDRLAKEIARSLKIDIRPVLSEHGRVMERFKEMNEWNVQLIKSIPDRMLDELEYKLETAWASGERTSSIEEIVNGVANDADVNAKRIARDQMNKMNSAFNQVRQTELGIESYIWRSSGDERTRADHKDLDGRTFRWDDPGPLTGTIDGEPCHPGQDIQCRCDAIPVFNLDAMEAEADYYEREAS